jgi:hypothetical protein
MAVARQGRAFSRPANGRVLVAGGRDDANLTLSSTELFDPTTGSFSPAGSMTTARHSPVAALVEDGSVLIVGGENADGNSASAELYKP